LQKAETKVGTFGEERNKKNEELFTKLLDKLDAEESD
jgi:hypothetical protein